MTTTKQNTKKQAVIAVIVSILIIACFAGVSLAGAKPDTKEQDTQTEQVETQATTNVKFGFDIADFSDESTPLIMKIIYADGSEEYKAINASDINNFSLDLVDGTYTIDFISPINSDGAIYLTPDAFEVVVENGVAKAGQVEGTLTIPFTKIAAEDVTNEQIEVIKSDITNLASANILDTSVVDKATANADNGKSARESKSDEDKEKSQEKSAETQADKASSVSPSTTATSTTTKATNAKSDTSHVKAPSTTAPANNSNNTAPANNTHTHNWVAQYKTVHHDAVTKQEPVYETKRVHVCNTCGAKDIDRAHTEAHMLAGEGGSSHTEKIQVQTGTKTVTVQKAYDEKVLTGYKCSGCGATK